LITAAVRSVGAKVLHARLHAVLEVNGLAELAELRVPILCLCASEDWLVPKASRAQICAANPAVHVVQIVGPHCLLQARPQQSAAAINEFIAHHSHARSPLF
jgi:pimeloyl-ACP methyl ester carboxylesterase